MTTRRVSLTDPRTNKPCTYDVERPIDAVIQHVKACGIEEGHFYVFWPREGRYGQEHSVRHSFEVTFGEVMSAKAWREREAQYELEARNAVRAKLRHAERERLEALPVRFKERAERFRKMQEACNAMSGWADDMDSALAHMRTAALHGTTDPNAEERLRDGLKGLRARLAEIEEP